jgi:hypothetical protein
MIIIQPGSKYSGLIFFMLLLFSCSAKKQLAQTPININQNATDYSILYNWASHPWKPDPADKIPATLPDKKTDSLADVFFIHPTTYTDPRMPMGWNADINNEYLNNKTDNGSMLYQASVFNRYCRVFAPRYRQANLEAFFTKNKVTADSAFNIAYEDVKAAFEYYLANYNHNRPIIIASHSQGTLHAARLLKEYFEGKKLMKQLVAAYIIGLPVYRNYFSILKPCQDSMGTGCFISWRTFKEGHVADFIEAEKDQAYVVNPLTWTTDSTHAPSILNKGGLLRDFNKIIPALVHARIHGNVLWVNKPHFFGDIFLVTKNYHIADYNFFYLNIRENAGLRIKTFLKK